jgi:hypothetical protein
MRKTKFLFTLVAAFSVMAFSAQAASALSITGSTPFTGSQVSASQVFNIGSAVRVVCTTASVTNGTLPANALGTPSTNEAKFNIAYSGCTATIAGLGQPATVTTSCSQWEVAPSTYSGGSGAGVIRACASISVPSLGCVITVPLQTITSGGTYTNVSPNVNVIANIAGGTSGINWTQNGGCPGIGASATSTSPAQYAGYQGTVKANGLTVIP